MAEATMKGAWLLVAVLTLGCGAERGEGPAPSPRDGVSPPPPVVLITLDTTRADRLEPYGATDASTPELAALADRGIVFDQATAVSPITAPSHASLFTGLYPPGHGVHDNGYYRLPASIPTLAELLSANGYRTAGFVSAAVLERLYGLDRGFELYDDDLASSGARREARMMLERPASMTVDRALAWLDRLGAKETFFLWVHLFDPHSPYLPPEPWKERFADRPYDGEIAFMDAEVGRLLRHPRLAEESAVVAVIGDHGESRGEHGEATHGLLIYQSTLRIPWILRLPGGPRGVRVDAPISQVDLLPTLVDRLALAADSQRLDGLSLMPALRGESLERSIYAESEAPLNSYGWAKLHSVRDGDLKYIAAPREELYDLGRDPGELDDIAATSADEVDRLAGELERLLASPAPQPAELETDETTRARLEALGYVVRERDRQVGAGRGDPKLLIDLHEALQTTAVMLASGRAEEAVRRLRTMSSRDPGNLGVLRQLVRGQVLSDRLDEAAEVAAEVGRLAPTNPRAYVVQADVAYRSGDIEAALGFVDRALELDPDLFQARLERARYLGESGRLAEASAEFEALAADSGSRPWLELRRAEVIDLPQGRLAEAEARLRRALEIDPFIADAWVLLADILTRQGRQDEALSAVREGLELNPGERLLETRLALTLAAQGDPEGEAAAIWREHLERYPRSAQAWVNLAFLEMRNQRWAEAERLAREAAERDPERPAIWNAIGIAAENQERLEEAVGAYRRAVQIDPGYWQSRVNLGTLLHLMGRHREAATELGAVLDQVPEHPGAHFILGLIYSGPLSDPARGRRHLETTIRLAPDSERAAEARRMLERLAADAE